MYILPKCMIFVHISPNIGLKQLSIFLCVLTKEMSKNISCNPTLNQIYTPNIRVIKKN